MMKLKSQYKKLDVEEEKVRDYKEQPISNYYKNLNINN